MEQHVSFVLRRLCVDGSCVQFGLSGRISAKRHVTIVNNNIDTRARPISDQQNNSSEMRMTMAKEYSVTLHEPPTTQLIREGMEQHLNQVAQDGWRMVTVVKETISSGARIAATFLPRTNP